MWGKYPYFWRGRIGPLQTQCRTGWAYQ